MVQLLHDPADVICIYIYIIHYVVVHFIRYIIYIYIYIYDTLYKREEWFNSYTTLPMSLSPDFAHALCDRPSIIITTIIIINITTIISILIKLIINNDITNINTINISNLTLRPRQARHDVGGPPETPAAL